MFSEQHLWKEWAGFLQRLGLGEWAASVLEAVNPLTILGAQMIYICQPLLSHTSAEIHLDAMAKLLEDKVRQQAFIAMLRELPSK